MNSATPLDPRILELLREVWTVESMVAHVLDRRADLSTNAEACRLYWDQAETSREQAERLGQRLRQAGLEPVHQEGRITASLTYLRQSELLPIEPSQLDYRHLKGSYAVAQLEAAMYRTLRALAESLSDHPTAALASDHLAIEERFSRRVWPYLGLLEKIASRPPRIRALLASG